MRKIFVTDHIADFNALIGDVSEEIEKNKKEMTSCSTRKLQSFLKKLIALKKQVPHLSRTHPPTASTELDDEKIGVERKSHLQNPLRISPELAFFLQVPPDTLLRRSEIITALCVYCHLKEDETREHVLKWKHLNPGSMRDLRDHEAGTKRGRIIPDEILNDLLKFDAYVLAVRDQKIYTKKRDKETGLKYKSLVTDEGMYMWTFSKLITPHLSSAQ